jgi:hypothetical protein
MKRIATLCAVFALSSMACVRSPEQAVRTVESPGAPFAGYRTFAFQLAEDPPAPYAVSARSFEAERRIQRLIDGELARKGYSRSDDRADFLVRFSSGNATVEVYAGSEQAASTAAPEYQTRGVIVIDAFDATTGAQVWHGTAEAAVDPQRIDDRLLQTAVQRVLAKFPAPSSEATQGARLTALP